MPETPAHPHRDEPIEDPLHELEQRLVQQHADNHPLMEIVIREYVTDASELFARYRPEPNLVALVERAVIARLELEVPI